MNEHPPWFPSPEELAQFREELISAIAQDHKLIQPPETVYIITHGEYSAYQIMRVYLDKEQAEEFVKNYNATGPYDQADIEEWPIGVPIPGKIPGCYHCMRDGQDCPDHSEAVYAGREIYDGVIYLGAWWDFWFRGLEVSTSWFTGPKPPKAEVINRVFDPGYDMSRGGTVTPPTGMRAGVEVRGTDKDYVTKVLADEVAQLKAQIAGIT